MSAAEKEGKKTLGSVKIVADFLHLYMQFGYYCGNLAEPSQEGAAGPDQSTFTRENQNHGYAGPAHTCKRSSGV
jgi:hypothetical protein